MSKDISLPTGEIIYGYSRNHTIQLCKNNECTYLVDVKTNKIDTDIGYSVCSSCNDTATWDMTTLTRLRPVELLQRMKK